jgi:hypothetical protein
LQDSDGQISDRPYYAQDLLRIGDKNTEVISPRPKERATEFFNREQFMRELSQRPVVRAQAPTATVTTTPVRSRKDRPKVACRRGAKKDNE